MSITTKKGDDGYTDIIGGKRLPKDHLIPECLGAIDELDAFLGDAKAALPDNAADFTVNVISGIQKDLIKLMGIIAGMPVPKEGTGEGRINSLIKELESLLPPFSSFAVPGANPVSAKLHIARTVCRRAERRLVSLSSSQNGSEIAGAVGPYINRLSDLLFLLAQYHQINKQ
ncbi:MAG: cob(I)yrinic acid a,c-diamide adenosyltransferase [Treponema sp.]|nr:cob(I)yrinic acid a,c-diamide adenosyltransferase [Treponema sp.]